MDRRLLFISRLLPPGACLPTPAGTVMCLFCWDGLHGGENTLPPRPFVVGQLFFDTRCSQLTPVALCSMRRDRLPAPPDRSNRAAADLAAYAPPGTPVFASRVGPARAARRLRYQSYSEEEP